MVERGRSKCAQYWSPDVEEEMTAGNFTVKTLEVETNADFIMSSLLLKNNKVIFIEYFSFMKKRKI